MFVAIFVVTDFISLVKNLLLTGADNRPMALDAFYTDGHAKPVVIYAHGFNGFKDWGGFDLIATQFAEAGFFFVKFNFSHDGTTPQVPEDFTDLEAYGNNNYTKELYDLQTVIDWTVSEDNPYKQFIDKSRLYLIGHSRGGGMVLVKGAEESRVKSIVTWASVAECKTPWGSWPEERIEKWEHTGVDHYTNSRTGQQMPLYFQLYEDYQANKDRLDIITAVRRLTIPLLVCHGTNDEAVPVAAAHRICEAATEAELFLLPSDHVFGRKHPWTEGHLPDAMQTVVTKTINFFKLV